MAGVRGLAAILAGQLRPGVPIPTAADSAGPGPSARPRPLATAACVPITCDDADPCTDDQCDAAMGCTHPLHACFADIQCALGRDRDLCASSGAPAKGIVKAIGKAGKLLMRAEAKRAKGKLSPAALALARAQLGPLEDAARIAAKLERKGKAGACVQALRPALLDRTNPNQLQNRIGELKNGLGGDLPDCAPAQCGNGKREKDEQCDGGDPAGVTCANAGFDGGTLSCDPS